MSKKTRLAEKEILPKTFVVLSSMVSSYGRLKFDQSSYLRAWSPIRPSGTLREQYVSFGDLVKLCNTEEVKEIDATTLHVYTMIGMRFESDSSCSHMLQLGRVCWSWSAVRKLFNYNQCFLCFVHGAQQLNI